jgi:hypothetical protein
MKTVGPILLLVSGILAFIGVFMPWTGEYGFYFSGFQVLIVSGVVGDTTPIFYMLIGSILLLLLALSVLIISANTWGSQKVVLSLCILASLGAALGIGGASWFISDAIANDAVEILSYGFYISYAAAALGLIFGVVTAIGSQRT